MATQELINVGNIPNNRTGDPIRIAFVKVNNNFTNLSSLDANIVLAPITVGMSPNDDAGSILRAAFNTINENFANLTGFYGNLEVINLGSSPNDTTGDNLRSAFTKINNNFSNLFPLVTSIPSKHSNFEFIESINKNVTFSYDIYEPTLLGSSQQVINIGAAPNDGTGDPLRTAFSKINNNFANLFATTVVPVTANTTGNTANQVIFSTEIIDFSQAQFNIRSTDSNVSSQNIILSAQLNDGNTDVKFSAYGTTFFGNAICTYNMDVDGSNVRILCSPLVSSNLSHTIFSQIMTQA